jgi:hypothetical protein
MLEVQALYRLHDLGSRCRAGVLGFARRACGMPSRLPSSSLAICVTTSHRFASAAKTNARAKAVSTTFDSSYASDDSVTTPRTIAHLRARSDTSAGSASVLIVPD